MSAAFDAFWQAVDDELRRYPMAAELTPLPLRSTDFAITYAVRLTSIGPYRIFGYYSVPRTPRPAPGLLLTPRYGSVNHVPDYFERERYAVLQIMHRGQRLADQPFAAAYPGLLTLGIGSPESYVYRGIVADCLRAAEFLQSRPEVDASRIGLQGDDLALLTTARRPGVFKAIQASELLLYRLLDASQRSDAYPAEELNDYLRAHPTAQDAVARTLACFDPVPHAPAISATTLLTVGDDEQWLQPLLAALGNHAQTYRLTHHGATDHEWLDAWLADQLGGQPRPRFLERV